MLGVPGVAGRREEAPPVWPDRGPFIGGELAHDDGARRAQPPHHFRVLFGKGIGTARRIGGCRHSGNIDQVLDADGNAMERSAVDAGGQIRIGGLGLAQRRFG